MISEDQNKALLLVAEKTRQAEEWRKYAEYCTLREKGLRKASFAVLNEFLVEVRQWTYEQKKSFVICLMQFCETVPDADYGPLPTPLVQQVVVPTLETWCESELEDSTPFRWLGIYFYHLEYLYKALEVDATDDRARGRIVSDSIGHIEFSTHHLPDYFIGEPNEVVDKAKEVYIHITKFIDDTRREYWRKELEKALLLVHNYIAWIESGHTNLVEWGKENNTIVSSAITTVYYNL
ncbi:MAG: hypothetical protein LBI73_05030 [Myroides sp.]|jgi:hypothetical protein|nr:hypothetical protein [Myroides sp.]